MTFILDHPPPLRRWTDFSLALGLEGLARLTLAQNTVTEQLGDKIALTVCASLRWHKTTAYSGLC